MDAGAIANVLRRPVAPTEDSGFVRVALNVKLAIAVATTHGGRAELARELQALAGRYPVIRLVQAPGGPARLEAGRYRWPVAAGLRDALLTALRTPSETAASARAATSTTTSTNVSSAAAQPATGAGVAVHQQAVAEPGPAAIAVARATAPAGTTALRVENGSASAVAGNAPTVMSTFAAAAGPVSPAEVVALAAASQRAAAHWSAMPIAAPPQKERASAVGMPAQRLALPFAAPLFDDAPDSEQTAVRLRAAVSASGVFTEAQLARAVTRPAVGMAVEAADLRELMRAPAELSLVDRTAAQLEALRKDALAFAFSPWVGQKADLDMGRERIESEVGTGGTAAPAQVFFATLHLDLPQLGAVTIRLRLVISTLAASVEAADSEPWQAALPELAAQLDARGLRTAALVTSTVPRGESHAASA